MNRYCFDCGKSMVKTMEDHFYGYDHGKKILLRGIEFYRCDCGYYEVSIPRMGPLHETIKQSLSVLRVPREKLAFFFTLGDKGVEDGAWGVSILSGGGATP